MSDNEVEKHKKWVVRSKKPDCDGDYGYVQRNSLFHIEFTDITPSLHLATKFNSKKEAEHWVSPYQEVIEVEQL